MGPEQALSDQYEVLFIDDVCSFLTPRLVRSVRDMGREIIGVYDPADAADAKRHLLECGVTDVIEQDAMPEEFLAAAEATLLHRETDAHRIGAVSPAFRVGVLGPIGGVGSTEIAIGLASTLALKRATVLVDLDMATPSLAQRLDLPLHPNLLTAVDAAHHRLGSMAETVLADGGIDVVGGLVNSVVAQGLPPIEIEGVLDELGKGGYEVVVADLGSPSAGRVDHLRFQVLIVVGLANPVGMARMVRTIQDIVSGVDMPDTVGLVNRVGPGSRRRLEIRAEMARLLPTVPVILVPEDNRLERASWDGKRVTRGPFAKSVGKVASLIDRAVG
jgi:MinD-like ATPase involved in chromosome partitioning or flagellar assembly